MRILQMLLSPRIGGAETLAYSLEQFWREQGVETQTAYIDSGKSPYKSRLNRIRNIRSAYKKFHPDIILSHSALPNAYCRLALPRNIPVVPVLHSSADDYSAWSLRYLERILQLWRRDAVVAVSELAMNHYVSRFPRHQPIHIIGNGVTDPGHVTRPAPVAPRIVTLARVAPMKNPWLWKTVVDHYEDKHTAMAFDWIGPIEPEDDVRALVSSHETGNSSSHFVGPINNASSVLGQYDIYFHPSDREAFGIAVVEAAMAGLPIVTSDAVAQAVGSGLVSRTFTAGDANSATKAIDDVIVNYHSYMSTSLERRKFALDKYSIDKTAESYLMLFKKILTESCKN